MAFADYAAYLASKKHGEGSFSKVAITTTMVTGKMYSRWAYGPFAGTSPSTAAACDNTTPGALIGSLGLTGLTAWIKTLRFGNSTGGVVVIYDRLSHQGGLVGNVTTEQTTNLPTAALTRYTSGVGVMMSYENQGTAIGSTATTLSARYTNSAGTANRTSPAVTIGGSSNMNTASIWCNIPLQVGDIGVRSVEGVTLAASTGTAGNFGITLWKPLLAIPVYEGCCHFEYDTVRDLGALFEQVQSGACLAMLQGVSIGDSYAGSGSIDLVKA